MKFTLSWLKRHLQTDATLKDITEKLTAIGLEVESVIDPSALLKPFIVAHIISTERHPNADRLQICQVDTGKGVLQVVCGAPNARADLKGVFAPVGSVIPATQTELKKGIIRGVESNGMMCSARELGLPDESDKGIMELDPGSPVGHSFAEVAGLNDPVIEINLTPNRADCAGVRGIARDLAAAGIGTLKPLNVQSPRGVFKSPVGVTIDSSAKVGCLKFTGRFIRGVKNGPSPKWLQDKLAAVGLRPVSALVDITNYMTLDQARPLHVFDADRLKGSLVVRLSQEGEILEALNNKTYTLSAGLTVVADDSGAIGLGGVIGGQGTSCTLETVNVFVECALFDPDTVAQAGRALDLHSDARYRFERGVDPDSLRPGLDQATQLILDICGGEVSDMVVAGEPPPWRRTYTLRPDRCETLGGVAVPMTQQQEILGALGFTVIEEVDSTVKVTPPSWRGDIHGEADLVEEVLRIYGFDSIPSVEVERSTGVAQSALTASQKRASVARRTLASRGLDEAVTWSFMSRNLAEWFGSISPSMVLLNPISADLDTLRPSILPNLLMAAARNSDRGYPDGALFEVGPVFHSGKPEDQSLVATGLRVGHAAPRHWSAPQREIDFFDVKADVLTVLESMGTPVGSVTVESGGPSHYHPGRAAVFRLGSTVLGYGGMLHPSLLKTLKIEGAVAGFEIFLNALPLPKKRGSTAKPLVLLSSFQPLHRDFAFVVDVGIQVDAIIRAVKNVDKKLIQSVNIFDVYVGKGIPEGKKSVALSVMLQPFDSTLTDDAIDLISQNIVGSVVKSTGALLRA